MSVFNRVGFKNPRRLKTALELDREFTKLDDTGEAWDDLRNAITNNQWDQICSQGNADYVVNTYYRIL